MNLKSFFLCGLVLTGLGVGTVHAQYSKMPAGEQGPILGSGPSAMDAGPIASVPPGTEMGGPPVLSSWITNCRNGCQFPLGGNGPIQYELYLNPGLSFPVGGTFFGRTLRAGWEIQGGGRTLFFNTAGDAAWTADVSLSNVHNRGERSDLSVTLHNINVRVPSAFGNSAIQVPAIPVTTEALNRTFLNLGFGRELYLYGPPQGDNWTWRTGFDAGARYGTAKLELHEIQHRTDTIAGAFVSFHSDVEIPCGCTTAFAGVRLEWDYTWMDILQSRNNGDVQDINLILNLGFRF